MTYQATEMEQGKRVRHTIGIKAGILILMIMSSFQLFGQISGLTTVTVGQSKVYTYTDDAVTGTPTWSAALGVVTATSQTGFTYRATILWSSPGNSDVTFSYGAVSVSLQVLVNCSGMPADPSVTWNPDPVNCSPRTVTYTGTPPAGVTWYWVSSPTGTETGFPASGSTVAYAGTNTFYLRAQNNSTGCWSAGAATTTVVTNPSPGTPTTPSVSTNTCGAKTITRGTPPANITWYWQTAYNGTDTFNSSTTYSATTTGTYYLRGRDNTTLCWGSSNGVSVTVNDAPIPNYPDASTNTCGPKTLTVAGSPPAGVNWYWQATNSAGTSTTSPYTSAYTASGSGTYYLRAQTTATGCWSAIASSVTVTVNQQPFAPTASIVLSTQTCGPKTATISGTPPSGDMWHWQGTNPSGTSINAATTQQINSSGTYYLRALNGAGCWSASSQSISATVNDIPPTPNTPVAVNGNCNTGSISVTGVPPANVNWYWQGTIASGVSTVNVYSTPQQLSASGTYYLRAQATNGCWSQTSSSATATVVLPPNTPNASLTTTSNTCGPQTVTIGGSAPLNEVWHWQGTNPAGTSFNPAGTSKIAYQSGTYYVRSFNGTSACWSLASASIAVTVNDPPAPTLPTSTGFSCGSQTLTEVGSPPANSGIGWYWQGTNGAGVDSSSPIATAGTYVASSTGTYYLGAKNSLGCWSYTPIPVTVTFVNPAAPPIPVAPTNTCGSKFYARPSSPPGVTYYWQGTSSTTQDAVSAVATASTFEAAYSTTYYLRAKDNNGPCWSNYTSFTPFIDPVDITVSSYDPINTVVQATHSITLSPGFDSGTGNFNAVIAITAECNNQVNWTEVIAYDMNGNIISDGRTYTDGFGTKVQNQTKDILTGKVWGSQSILNSFGQVAGSTLSAPLLENDFIYKKSLAFNQAGQPYSPSDFDLRSNSGVTGEISNPAPFGNQLGSIGWYYSSANNLEPNAPTTQFPFSRSFAAEGPDPTITRASGPGEAFRMGGGHEVKSERYLIAPGELNHYFQMKSFNSWNSVGTTGLGYKQISTDPNGAQAVSFVDSDGRKIASATVITSNYSSIPPSFTYDNWSYVFYNDAGQVIVSVPPNGVNTSSATATFATFYLYDHRGFLIESTSPDEGKIQYVYSSDGKIRFSQNDEQRNATPPRFSYTNYDYLGRLVESGEYTCITGGYVFEPSTTAVPSGVSVLLLIDRNFTVPIDQAGPSTYSGISYKSDNSRCKDYSFITYDVPGSGAPLAQTNLYGQVSKTANANATTWYSYDEFGHLLWTRQNIVGLGIKSVDYTYDYFGNVTQVAYQAGQSDKFYHHYEYDINQKLVKAFTSFDGVNKTLQANNKYYLHGPMKRMELAGNLQGLDYVYMINGALKSINNVDVSKDPGSDGNNGFSPDVYGQTFSYYDNDYVGAGYSTGNIVTPGVSNQYGGAIKAQGWYTPVDNPSSKKVYGYTYDNRYQLQNAQFGTLSASVGNYNTTFAEGYREGGLAYDKNGNIQSLLRKDKGGNITANYGYVYESGTNRLDKVNNGASVLTDYTYNRIGQMVQQVEAGKTMNVSYTPYGLTKDVKDASGNLMVSYLYDDTGDRIVKTNYNASGVANRNTYYVSDASGNTLAIYEQILPGGAITLAEVPVYASGRIGLYKPGSNSWFYEISDHLGNVRAVIGPPKTDVYLSTMESEVATQEDAQFRNISPRVPWVNGTVSPPAIVGNEAIRLNNTRPAGAGISLKVSPGDIISVEVYAYYEGCTDCGNTLPLTTIVNGIAGIFGAVGATPGDKGITLGSMNGALTGGSQLFAGAVGSGNNAVPAAYLNMITFNNNLDVPSPSEFPMAAIPVTASANMQKQKLVIGPITMPSPGYVYIYLNNNSNSSAFVYFDDLKVTQVHSPFVAGADYYPFGLTMSDREITTEPYRFGYQGQYSEKDKNTGWNEFELRMYDARFGRWITPDPNNEFYSSYVSMGNRPHTTSDPTGGLTGENKLLEDLIVTASRLPSYETIASRIGVGIASSLWSNATSSSLLSRSQTICPTCPKTPEYDIYRNSNLHYGYHKAVSGDGTFLRLSGVVVKAKPVDVMWFCKLGANLITQTILLFAGGAPFESMGVGAGRLGYYTGTTRVFWSGAGNPEVYERAQAFAKSIGGTTLEMTRAGRNLEKLTEGMTFVQRTPMWNRLSSAFAEGSEGTVHVFQNANKLNISTWGTVEYPILKARGIKIIYHMVH